MIRWLVIHASPLQQVHDARARPYIDPSEASHEILVDAGTVRADTAGEIPNATYVLANSNGQAVPLLRRPPLGAEAVEYGIRNGAQVELFRGVVTRVRCGATASIEVSA
jgi:hypothetical protein